MNTSSRFADVAGMVIGGVIDTRSQYATPCKIATIVATANWRLRE